MDDKELVEVWRKEFEKKYSVNEIGAYFSKKDQLYCFYSIADSHNQAKMLKLLAINGAYDGWVTAKSSQPIVVLPWPEHYYDADGFRRNYWSQDTVLNFLAAAGIKYTIGE